MFFPLNCNRRILQNFAVQLFLRDRICIIVVAEPRRLKSSTSAPAPLSTTEQQKSKIHLLSYPRSEPRILDDKQLKSLPKQMKPLPWKLDERRRIKWLFFSFWLERNHCKISFKWLFCYKIKKINYIKNIHYCLYYYYNDNIFFYSRFCLFNQRYIKKNNIILIIVC